MGRNRSSITIIMFCLLIFGFTIATIFAPSWAFSETENRVLAGMPDLTASTVFSGEFEKDYEEYLTDQFVFRDWWISLKTTMERLLLKQESKDIYFAKDGYFIEKHTGSFMTQTARRNISTLTRTENGREILIIKDSYANCFIPFMLWEFQQIDVLDLRYTSQKLSEIIETGGYIDLLVLYNVSGFAEDISIAKLIN